MRKLKKFIKIKKLKMKFLIFVLCFETLVLAYPPRILQILRLLSPVCKIMVTFGRINVALKKLTLKK